MENEIGKLKEFEQNKISKQPKIRQKNLEKFERFREMLTQGQSLRKIIKELGISSRTAIKWKRELEGIA